MDILTENYKLYHGDCLEVMDLLINEEIKVDAIICDPPYGTTTCKWDTIIPFNEMWEKLKKIVKPNGAIILFGNMPFTSVMVASNLKGYKHHWIWKKNRGTGFQVAKYRPMMAHEDIIVFTIDGKKVNYYPQKIKLDKPTKYKTSSKTKHNLGTDGKEIEYYTVDSKYPINVIEFDKVNKPIHPTQKPINLLEYLIKTYTNENETVLDFTMGSGSTGVACMNCDRRFIGIELDENYFNIAVNRIFENYDK